MEIERFADVVLNINLIIIVFKCNHVKLEIRSFVINFNSRVCVYQMVKTHTEPR